MNLTVMIWIEFRAWRPSLVVRRKSALLSNGNVSDLYLNTQTLSLIFKSAQGWKFVENVEKPYQIPPLG